MTIVLNNKYTNNNIKAIKALVQMEIARFPELEDNLFIDNLCEIEHLLAQTEKFIENEACPVLVGEEIEETLVSELEFPISAYVEEEEGVEETRVSTHYPDTWVKPEIDTKKRAPFFFGNLDFVNTLAMQEAHSYGLHAATKVLIEMETLAKELEKEILFSELDLKGVRDALIFSDYLDHLGNLRNVEQLDIFAFWKADGSRWVAQQKAYPQVLLFPKEIEGFLVLEFFKITRENATLFFNERSAARIAQKYENKIKESYTETAAV